MIIKLETGMLGSDFAVSETDGIDYASITPNGTAVNPETKARGITAGIIFSEAQT